MGQRIDGAAEGDLMRATVHELRRLYRLVDRVGLVVKERLTGKALTGKRGWDHPENRDQMRERLARAVEAERWEDAVALSAFLWHLDTREFCGREILDVVSLLG